jgi:hypothetical protein
MINACRLFLQVNTMAEITNHQGIMILSYSQTGEICELGKPKLHRYSVSLLKWPNQECPPKKAWAVWKQYLCHLAPSQQLHHTLGPWYVAVYQQRQWNYVHQGDNILNISETCTQIYYPTPSRTRNRQKYVLGDVLQTKILNTNLPVTLHCVSPNFIYSYQPYIHTFIPNNNDIPSTTYKVYTYIPEFPTDGSIHLYTQTGDQMTQIKGIIVSNNKNSSVIDITYTNLHHATVQTIELKCLRLNIHNVVALYSRYLSTLTVHVHCKTSKTYMGLQTHNITSYSPKQCLQTDWDKFQEIALQSTLFQDIKYHDATKHIVVQHSEMLDK